MARHLGIDYGTVRVGLAISDSFGIIARPYKTLYNNDLTDLVKDICEIIAEKKISVIVFGRPLHLSGDESDMFIKIKELADLISSKCPEIEIHFHDERFSSIEACGAIRAMGGKPSRNKPKIDAIAASLVLKAYLESVNDGEDIET
ncbi:MAG TPA: Holliday junction resolvase RuvX [candidate division Zixibacteria bacterium]|nr:Holliday junction resolvase RuvX [candidate division Zixibacteria bacterium]